MQFTDTTALQIDTEDPVLANKGAQQKCITWLIVFCISLSMLLSIFVLWYGLGGTLIGWRMRELKPLRLLKYPVTHHHQCETMDYNYELPERPWLQYSIRVHVTQLVKVPTVSGLYERNCLDVGVLREYLPHLNDTDVLTKQMIYDVLVTHFNDTIPCAGSPIGFKYNCTTDKYNKQVIETDEEPYLLHIHSIAIKIGTACGLLLVVGSIGLLVSTILVSLQIKNAYVTTLLLLGVSAIEISCFASIFGICIPIQALFYHLALIAISTPAMVGFYYAWRNEKMLLTNYTRIYRNCLIFSIVLFVVSLIFYAGFIVYVILTFPVIR